MKKTYSLILITGFLLLSLGAISQPPPPQTGNNNFTNAKVGGGAPIENGSFILLTLAMAYAARKVYVMRSKPSKA
ncbi:MAG: hypothetical protein WCR72_08450 [Bacteroidota bacterium]